MARVDITDIQRREVLDAACRVFAGNGCHNAGMADVAAAMNAGRGTVCRYFDGKPALAPSRMEGANVMVSAAATAGNPSGRIRPRSAGDAPSVPGASSSILISTHPRGGADERRNSW